MSERQFNEQRAAIRRRPWTKAKNKAIGYAARHCFSHRKPFEFERLGAAEDEVEIKVLYCGVCHSDIHQVKNEWRNTIYPCMPGHEVVGRVTKVGSAVTLHKVGDLVGVGCMIDSCGVCEPCKAGQENYCESPNSWLATYNGPMVPADQAPGMRISTGGTIPLAAIQPCSWSNRISSCESRRPWTPTPPHPFFVPV